MPDEPGRGGPPASDAPELIRVSGRSGIRWILVWLAGGVMVASFGVAGTLMNGPDPVPQTVLTPVVSDPPTAPDASPGQIGDIAKETVSLPPIDITSGASGYAAAFEARRRQSVPLIIESTDFHANSGSAYYGIGGKLLRALAPTPSATPAP